MSRQHARSVYVRRRLLLLAAAILVAWLVVQFWPSRSGNDAHPTSTSTVTAIPPTPTPSGSVVAKPTPKPKPTPTPLPGATTSVTLTSGTKACTTRDVTITPSVVGGQYVRHPVLVDVAVSTSATKPCVFTPKALDPLAVITHNGDSVWDSSVCQKAIVGKPIQLVPGWAATVRVPWIPRKSGDACKPDEKWLKPGTYTLRVGTLGGEPARADFTLVEPPKPKPTPTPTPTPTATPTATASASGKPPATPAPSTKPTPAAKPKNNV